MTITRQTSTEKNSFPFKICFLHNILRTIPPTCMFENNNRNKLIAIIHKDSLYPFCWVYRSRRRIFFFIFFFHFVCMFLFQKFQSETKKNHEHTRCGILKLHRFRHFTRMYWNFKWIVASMDFRKLRLILNHFRAINLSCVLLLVLAVVLPIQRIGVYKWKLLVTQ